MIIEKKFESRIKTILNSFNKKVIHIIMNAKLNSPLQKISNLIK